MAQNYKRTRFACYFTNLTMSAAFSLPPLLFVTFREMYGVSYTLLGTLVVVNFCTQLIIDLIFSFFPQYFNVKKCVRTMPLLTAAGLLVYAAIPSFFPHIAYLGLVIGTVIFSVAAGLCEVLMTPTITAIPEGDPDKNIAVLHSLYGYGVLTVVVISTLFLYIFGNENWMYLTLIWAILPAIGSVMLHTSPMPDVETAHAPEPGAATKKHAGMLLCFFCIFLGSAAENVMTNWVSGYIESALNVPKVAGDILGMAAFAVILALTRTVYAKYGKNIENTLLCSMIGAIACYLTVAFCQNVYISVAACALTGLCTSMLWPGTLILMEEKIPGPGVAAYALMAAGGDLGASIAPQLMGVVVDTVSVSYWANRMSAAVGLTAEQIGMKTGMLLTTVFPILGVLLILYIKRYFKKHA
ncbi:MAG: MFS transporter [Oscillospiraceae bacterium]|nr:MFS transporter [Oscillospiraceae bacterium]